MLHTTYNLAKKHNACERALEAWEKHVGKVNGDKPIPLTDVLDVLGIDDCLWAFLTVKDQDAAKIIAVKFAIACADRVLIHYETKYPKDKRPRQAIEAAQAYLLNPSKAAWAAGEAREAAGAAWAAAWAAREAAWAAGAAWAAREAAGAAAWAAWAAWAAREAAREAAWAAGAAEKQWQVAKLKELLEES